MRSCARSAPPRCWARSAGPRTTSSRSSPPPPSSTPMSGWRCSGRIPPARLWSAPVSGSGPLTRTWRRGSTSSTAGATARRPSSASSGSRPAVPGSTREMLPVVPPMPPMLARLARELPRGDYLYEPMWDGFRCLCFRDGDRIDLRSRHDRPLARYFPELVEALRAVDCDAFVLDGEAVVLSPGGFDFSALMARLHPAASRVERLARETPAHFVGFDLLAMGDEDLRPRRFETRREQLEGLLADPPDRLRLTPISDHPDVAEHWLERFQGAGIDGVVAKARDLRYLPGVRAMIKVKHERTADCVVGGFRVYADGSSLS